jgi:hypothetical protein
LISKECVHCAIFCRDRIRDKDKDPSFSAKPTRVNDEGVCAAIRECPLLAHWRHSGVCTRDGFPPIAEIQTGTLPDSGVVRDAANPVLSQFKNRKWWARQGSNL